MKRILLISALFLLSISSTFGQYDLKRTRVGRSISLKIPETLMLISEQVNSKSASARTPLAIYSNLENTVTITINENRAYGSGGDLEIYRDFYRSTLYNLYEEINLIRDEIREIGGKDFIVFEFQANNSDPESISKNLQRSDYIYISYTLANDAMIIISFICPGRERDRWSNKAHQVINSIRIK